MEMLDKAKAWTKALDTYFWNGVINGYCFYSDDSDPLFVRPRMVFDNPLREQLLVRRTRKRLVI